MTRIDLGAVDHETARELRRLVEIEHWEPDAALELIRKRRQTRNTAPPRDSDDEKVSTLIDDQRRTPERVQTLPERDNLPAPEPQNEKAFQNMCEMVFREHGFLCYHTYDSRKSEPGFPDLVCAHEQHGVVFAELKMPKGTLSVHQKRWIDTLHAAGARVYVWRPENWAEIMRVAGGEK